MEVKQSYQEKMETQLKEWSTSLDECKDKIWQLKDRAETLEAQAKATCIETIKTAEDKTEELQIKLEVGRAEYEKLKETSEEAWGTLKTGVSLSWEDFREGVEASWEDIKLTMNEVSSKFK